MSNISNGNNAISAFVINNTSDASKCGLFEHIYSDYINKGFSYSAINILSDGSLEIDCFMPHISQREAEDFMNKPVRFYKKELPNGAISISIRGAVIGDYIIDPIIYPDNRIELIVETSWCNMFLVDTEDNSIKGIRFCILSDEIYEAIDGALQIMLGRGLKSIDLVLAFKKYIAPFSPSKFIQRATYLGREKGNIRTQNLTTF